MGGSNDYFISQDIMLMSNLSHVITPDIIFSVAYMKQAWTEDLLEHRTTNAFGVDENNVAIPTLAGMRAVQRQQKWNTDNLSSYFSINASTWVLKHKIIIGYDVMSTQNIEVAVRIQHRVID